MAAGIGIGIGADTRDFARAVKTGMVDPAEQAQKALEQIGDAATKGGTEADRSFRQQQQQTEQLRSDLDRLHQTISEGSRQAWQRASSTAHKAEQDVDEGFREMKDSARQNAIETAASFDGSFDSISGGAQGLISEFAAGFGPGGVIAGVLAAGVIGVLTSQVDGLQQQTEAEQQQVQALTQELLDAGDKGKRSLDGIKSALAAMATDTDGTTAVISLQKAWDAAHKSGADYRQVVDSIASADPRSIGIALDAVDRLVEAHKAAATAANQRARTSGRGYSEEAGAAETLQAALTKAKTEATQAERAQQLAADAGISSWQRKADLIKQLSGDFDDAAGSIDDYVDKESGALNPTKYIAAMVARERALEHYKDDLLKSNLSPQAKSFLESQGADTAAAMVAGYKKATPAQKKELDRIWSAAGNQNVQTYDEAVGKAVKKLAPIKLPQLQIEPINNEQLARQARAAQQWLRDHPVHIPVVVAKTPYGKPLYG